MHYSYAWDFGVLRKCVDRKVIIDEIIGEPEGKGGGKKKSRKEGDNPHYQLSLCQWTKIRKRKWLKGGGGR